MRSSPPGWGVEGLPPFVVIVTGSRTWGDCDAIVRALVLLRHANPGRRLVVRYGDCPTGADHCVANFVEHAVAVYGWDVVGDPHEARWDLCGEGCPPRPHRVRRKTGDVHHPGVLPDYCPVAGPRRNARMVAAGAHVAYAYPTARSRGTHNCARLAARAGIPVEVCPGVRLR